MCEEDVSIETCIVIGASHAGVNFAFALRREGWTGSIILYDTDPELPYHRPPLSKDYLSGETTVEENLLRPKESYTKEKIDLCLGTTVTSINRAGKNIQLQNGSTAQYDKLVIATGGRPIIPPIQGVDFATHLFTMRNASDAQNIRKAFTENSGKRVVIIGGGYIGLETAASLRKLGGEVIILEREERVLRRVTAPVMSTYFHKLHNEHGVQIFTNKNVVAIGSENQVNRISCSDGSSYDADMIVMGVGIWVNKELAEAADLSIQNGIEVDETTRTTDEDIYAIGDCTYHYNRHYDRYVRLESVQNAVDQARVAAAAICKKEVVYDSIPWFWSDQYDVKLQMTGLSDGYNEVLIRKSRDADNRFSVWYFKDDILLAVDAVNDAKSYVLGSKFIKGNQKVDKAKLINPLVEFKPANLLVK